MKHLTASSVGTKAILSLNAAASDPAGTATHVNKTGQVYVVFDDTPLKWDTAKVRGTASGQ
ncbi:hypothetical protein [Streptomyces sp. NL15-2K]|uniref:hypothetical protein n=1 Tax=Streptomyces sp. NL15-2K TaxID=376149 RepID=UPI000F57E07A|nr:MULTISPECIES: hypothetical protein [Actinomycetes]WKX15790.1 hypothetical protein Q4V64_53160 [Kutzneria buriramensis]GCB42874.1 hypothetical protein SNL152K_157 [Streptomyces sp. NL15-2K]